MKLERNAIPYVILLLILTFASQSTSAQERGATRDAAVAVETGHVTDDLDGSADTYWYKFTAGPGKVVITFEVTANETNAGATLDVFSAGTRPILSNVLAQGVDKGTETVEKSIRLTKQQTIYVRIKGIKYGDNGGTGSYTLTVDGGEKKDGGDVKPDKN
jgi:hypothetical protein